MATITSEGGQLKVEQGSNISYYPLDDVSLTIITAKLRILVRQKEMHAFTYADITAPAGADLEAKADAIAALLGSHSVGGGGGGGDASAANQVLEIAELEGIAENTTKGNLTKLLTEANDLVHTYTWLDGGAADQRISTIVYSSTALALSVTETFTYSGGAGTYHVATSTLS